MLNGTEQQARDFLEEQLKDVQHKIARLEHVKQTCTDCAEKAGLDRMLRAFEIERQVIEELLARQTDGAVVPALGAQIVARIKRLQARATRPAARWRRGQPTPSTYWEAAHARTVLEQLLRRWHAWRDGRPYYPSTSNGVVAATSHNAPAARLNLRANPWGVPVTSATSSTSSAHSEDGEALAGNSAELVDEVRAVLERAGIETDHVDIVFASEHVAIVTAVVHTNAERRVIINTLIAQDKIELVLADIRVMNPDRCPVCKAREKDNGHNTPLT
jgi:hypothetical protein